MIFRSIKNLLASKDFRAQLKTFQIMKTAGGLIFYHAGIETGLFGLLSEPATPGELALRANIQDTELLSSLLELGRSLGELSCSKGTYRLKGPMSKALAHNVPLRELVRETVRYHGDVARRIGEYLAGGTKGDYLKEFGGVIAESSRLTEPLIRAFIYHTVKKSASLSILEIGCGAGEYLKYYVDINRDNGGVAIEIDPSAAGIAQGKLKEHGIEGNFRVMQGNILDDNTLKEDSFDLVTSYSNVYYFSDDDRMRVFRKIHGLLKSGGRFMLASAFKSRSLSSAYYDLVFTATRGLYPLPDLKVIVGELKQCGFSRVKTVGLFGRFFMGIVASK